MQAINSSNAAQYTAYPSFGRYTVNRFAILLAAGIQAKTDTIRATMHIGLKSSESLALKSGANCQPVNIFAIISHAPLKVSALNSTYIV